MSRRLLNELVAEVEVPDEDSEALFVRLRTAWNWSTDVFPDLPADECLTMGRTLEVEAEVPFFESETVTVRATRGLVLQFGESLELHLPNDSASALRILLQLPETCRDGLITLGDGIPREST